MGTRRHPEQDINADFDEHAIVSTGREDEAAGVKAVMVSLQRGLTQMGPVRTTAALARLNQRHGFDCPGCAWPEEPGDRKLAEFCENGAKAVAEEATQTARHAGVLRAPVSRRRWPSNPTTGWNSRAG